MASLIQAPNGAYWCTDCMTRTLTERDIRTHECHPEYLED